MIARVFGAQGSIEGGTLVTIETDLSRGLYSFSVVGLPDKAVEEARDRVSAAIKNSGFASPKSQNHKIIVSLAPADLKKEGPLFDLPIAIGYLIAAQEIRASLSHTLLLGELALDGTLRKVRGTLGIVQAAQRAGFREVIVPHDNASEAALVRDITVFGAHSLLEVIRHIDSKREDYKELVPHPPTPIEPHWSEGTVLLEDIREQETAKRGLLIAASGRHNSIMIGPPGTGKTMLARAFQSILPPLSVEEALEVTAIHSIAGTKDTEVITVPPFRAPHHTASYTALVGGGAHPRPGEVTLAHRGVLFLDEFPEFDRRSIDTLRQPLEDRVVSISRVQGHAVFPADFTLIAAMNPHRGTGTTHDHMPELMLETYKKKISGPIMDRIDLWLSVSHISYDALSPRRATVQKETEHARELVLKAREKQKTRYDSPIKTNASLSPRDIEKHIAVSDAVRTLLNTSAQKLNLSPRGYHRLIKVSRTIADLEESDAIKVEHVLEALQYRTKL